MGPGLSDGLDSKTRIEYIDIAKAYGILFVIAGHLFHYGGYVSRYIYNFHMPMFILLSGMVFRPRKMERFCFYVKRIFKKTVIPFVVYFALGIVLTALRACFADPDFFGGISEWFLKDGIEQIKSSIWNAEPITFSVGPIWFLIALFWIQVAGWVVYKYIIEKERYILLFLYVLLVLWYADNQIQIRYTLQGRIPFKIDSAVIGTIFWIAGCYVSKLHIIERISRNKTRLVGISAILLFLSMYNARLYGNGLVNLNEAKLNDIHCYYYNALIGSFAWIMISYLTKSLLDKRVVRVISYIGQNTLSIMALHMFVIYVWCDILDRLLGYTIDNGSNMPVKYCFLGIVFVIIVLLPIVVLKNRIITLRKYY